MSCRGRKPTLRLRPTLLHKSQQAAAYGGAYLQFSGSFYLKIKSKKKQKYLGVEKELPSLTSIRCWVPSTPTSLFEVEVRWGYSYQLRSWGGGEAKFTPQLNEVTRLWLQCTHTHSEPLQSTYAQFPLLYLCFIMCVCVCQDPLPFGGASSLKNWRHHNNTCCIPNQNLSRNLFQRQQPYRCSCCNAALNGVSCRSFLSLLP